MWLACGDLHSFTSNLKHGLLLCLAIGPKANFLALASSLEVRGFCLGLALYWHQSKSCLFSFEIIGFATIKPFQVTHIISCFNKKAQLSLTNPRDAKACQKLFIFDVLTTFSLTILVYIHTFSCCCVRNLRNPEKLSENSNLQSSRSSKVIDLGTNRKRICTFLLVTNSNFGRISYRFRDIDAFSSKIACFPTPPLFDAPQRWNAIRYQRNRSIHH